MQVYCILGDERVMRSKSPTIFSAVLKRIGLKGSYVPFKVDPDQIGSALQSIRILNIAGASITIPFSSNAFISGDSSGLETEVVLTTMFAAKA